MTNIAKIAENQISDLEHNLGEQKKIFEDLDSQLNQVISENAVLKAENTRLKLKTPAIPKVQKPLIPIQTSKPLQIKQIQTSSSDQSKLEKYEEILTDNRILKSQVEFLEKENFALYKNQALRPLKISKGTNTVAQVPSYETLKTSLSRSKHQAEELETLNLSITERLLDTQRTLRNVEMKYSESEKTAKYAVKLKEQLKHSESTKNTYQQLYLDQKKQNLEKTAIRSNTETISSKQKMELEIHKNLITETIARHKKEKKDMEDLHQKSYDEIRKRSDEKNQKLTKKVEKLKEKLKEQKDKAEMFDIAMKNFKVEKVCTEEVKNVKFAKQLLSKKRSIYEEEIFKVREIEKQISFLIDFIQEKTGKQRMQPEKFVTAEICQKYDVKKEFPDTEDRQTQTDVDKKSEIDDKKALIDSWIKSDPGQEKKSKIVKYEEKSTESLPADWKIGYDENGNKYYLNIKTEEKRWFHPDKKEKGLSNASGILKNLIESKKNEALKKENSNDKSDTSSDSLPELWDSTTDEKGRRYYYHIETHERTFFDS